MELVVLDWEALGAAVEALRRTGRAFGADDLLALARADAGHDARLDPAYRSAILPFYASSLLGERAAEENARRAASLLPEPVARGLRSQAEDERRHAGLDDARLRLLGVDPRTARDVTPGVAREMAESRAFDDPLRRVFLTNFVGETALAAATFPYVIALAGANGDRLSVRLNRARLADEVRHAVFALRLFELVVGVDERNLPVLQRWQDEHFAAGGTAFLSEVAPALERAPRRPPGDWLGAALDAYRTRARRLGLRAP